MSREDLNSPQKKPSHISPTVLTHSWCYCSNWHQGQRPFQLTCMLQRCALSPALNKWHSRSILAGSTTYSLAGHDKMIHFYNTTIFFLFTEANRRFFQWLRSRSKTYVRFRKRDWNQIQSEALPTWNTFFPKESLGFERCNRKEEKTSKLKILFPQKLWNLLIQVTFLWIN